MPELIKTELHDRICAMRGPIEPIEGARLAYLASIVPPQAAIVEIGSNEGKSAIFMASGLKNLDARIHCVDLWDLGGPTQQPNYVSKTRHAAFLKNVAMFGFSSVISDHKAESTEFAKSWTGGIDLLFIDAGHTYEAAKADYDAWSPFVKQGGYIAFHDYKGMWPGVMMLVNQDVRPSQQWENEELVSSLLSFRKRMNGHKKDI